MACNYCNNFKFKGYNGDRPAPLASRTGLCMLYPEWESVYGDHFCGQFVLKMDWQDKPLMIEVVEDCYREKTQYLNLWRKHKKMQKRNKFLNSEIRRLKKAEKERGLK